MQQSNPDSAYAGIVRHWTAAVAVAVATGIAFLLLSGDGLPVPNPEVARQLFWAGWSPVAAAAIIAFLAITSGTWTRSHKIGLAIAAATAVAGWSADASNFGVAVLVAMHVPLVAWGAVGVAAMSDGAARGREAYAYCVRSMETVIVGGIFLGMGGIFAGLTAGLLSVFEIEPAERLITGLAAFGIGVIPVLAVATVFDPSTPLTAQKPTGLARLLRIVTWLLLPAALWVLALYVVWLIPVYFWRAFEERAVLAAYNATVMAIVALIIAAAAPRASGDGSSPRLLRYALGAVGGLGAVLNVYALAAITSRVLEYGWTPNRHVVLGWNVVTLLLLASLVTRLWPVASDRLDAVRDAAGRAVILPVLWAFWLIAAMPWLFR